MKVKIMENLEIYGFVPNDRSGRVRWLCEELAVPYKDHYLNYENKQQDSPEYLELNPMGRVPTAKWQDGHMHESTAICLYLADLHSEKGLAPAIDSSLRPEYLQWMVFCPATMEMIATDRYYYDQFNEDHRRTIDNDFKKLRNTLELALQDKEFIVGNSFTAADISLAFNISWFQKLIKESQTIGNYLKRMKARPACKKSGIFKGND